MLGSTPGTILCGRAVSGDMANAPTPEIPRLIILEFKHLIGEKAWKEIEGHGKWRRARKASHDDNPINGGAVLDEASCRIYALVTLSKAQVHVNKVTGKDAAGELAWPL